MKEKNKNKNVIDLIVETRHNSIWRKSDVFGYVEATMCYFWLRDK